MFSDGSRNLEMAIHRIYGPVFIDGEWKRRCSKEIYELLCQENIKRFRFIVIEDVVQ